MNCTSMHFNWIFNKSYQSVFFTYKSDIIIGCTCKIYSILHVSNIGANRRPVSCIFLSPRYNISVVKDIDSQMDVDRSGKTKSLG